MILSLVELTVNPALELPKTPREEFDGVSAILKSVDLKLESLRSFTVANGVVTAQATVSSPKAHPFTIEYGSVGIKSLPY